MPYTTYNCDALTGGGSRALDAISVANLNDKDRALVVVDGVFMPFLFDANATDAENVAVHPFKIRPDDYSTAGVWVEQWTGAPGENLLINGGFDIWQRGTSQTGYGYGSDDRWFNAFSGAGIARTHSRQAFTPGQTDVPGNPAYFSRTVISAAGSASTDFCQKNQKIEGVRTAAGSKVTLSFWAKADAAKNIAIDLYQDFGSGGTPSGAVTGIGGQLVALGTSWQKFEITIDVPSISGKTIGSDDFLCVVFWFDAGSSYDSRLGGGLGHQTGTFDLANVKLEAGEVATPFVRRPIAEELALCRRYFMKNTSEQAAMKEAGGAVSLPNPAADRMRASPTITYATSFPNAVHRPGIAFYAISSITAGGPYITIEPDTLFDGGTPCQILAGALWFDAEL